MNDDLGLVRGIRDDAPRADRARLAPGKQRLLAAMEGGGGRRRGRLRADWRFTALGAVTAVALAAVIGSQVMQGGGPATSTAPAGPGQVDATVVLDRASTAAGAASVPHPRSDQWIYTRIVQFDRIITPGHAETLEGWRAYTTPGHEKDPTLGDLGPRAKFQFLASLHGDSTKQLLGKARAAYPDLQLKNDTQAQRDFLTLTTLAEACPADPTGLALVYKALATVDGIKAERVKDAAGRDAYAVYVAQPERGAAYHGEMLVNAKTYAYDGRRQVAVRDTKRESASALKKAEAHMPKGQHAEPMTPMKKGDVAYSEAYLRVALVGGDHERP